tara:strand:- start:101 stop:319 length:219 start_codon:yes stop_codon:yes gene_type:complete
MNAHVHVIEVTTSMDRGVEGFVTSCVRVTLTGLFCPQYGQCYLRRYLPGRGVRMKFVFGFIGFSEFDFFSCH